MGGEPNPMLWVGYPRSYTAGRARAPQFVVMHYTAGSEGPTSAEAGVDYDKNRADGTSCHAFFDSEGPGLQEVPFGDRSHSAFFHGNEIGIQYELCGTIQTRDQWLDANSYPMLVTAAYAVAYTCRTLGLEMRRLTTAEVRAAYYNAPGERPTGICDHKNVTDAFPEDGGTHTDVGPEFPWDVFMDLVLEGDMAGDYGSLGPPPNEPQYAYDHPDVMLADLHAALVTRKTGWGGADSAAGWSLFQDLAALNSKLDQVLAALQGGVTVAAKVDLTDAAIAKVADATADEIHADPERDGV